MSGEGMIPSDSDPITLLRRVSSSLRGAADEIEAARTVIRDLLAYCMTECCIQGPEPGAEEAVARAWVFLGESE